MQRLRHDVTLRTEAGLQYQELQEAGPLNPAGTVYSGSLAESMATSLNVKRKPCLQAEDLTQKSSLIVLALRPELWSLLPFLVDFYQVISHSEFV